MQRTQVDISTASIIRAILIVVGCLLLFTLREVIAILFFVLILTSAVSPTILNMQKKWRIPRIMAILLIYLLIVAAILLIGYSIIPPAVTQLQNLANNLPNYFEKLKPIIAAISGQMLKEAPPTSLDTASKALGSIGSSLLNASVGFFGGLVNLVTILVLTFFLLLDEDGVKSFFMSLLPVSEKALVVDITKKIATKIGSWLTGQLILMAIIAVITLVGLILLQIPYALTLALVAGLFEIVPAIGPILSAIPAVFIALVIKSPWMALVVLIFYVVVQQVEAHIFVPKVMQKAVGLSPIIIILAILVGARLAGVFGVLLAVPAAAGFSVLVSEWPEIKKKINRSQE